MKLLKKHAKVFGMLCLLVLLCAGSVGMTARAAVEYEPLTVEIPYKHVYTTTDTSVDSLFHYRLTAKDGAPMAAEADKEGTFSFEGVEGTGEEVEGGTLFVLDGKLTFTFTKPGVYEYLLAGNPEADADKVADGHYTLEAREFDFACYIVNDPDGGMRLTMLTSEEDGVKVTDIELDPSYKGEEPETEPETTVPETQPTPPTPPKTGDGSPVLTYVVLLTVSAAAVVLLVLLQTRREKGRE